MPKDLLETFVAADAPIQRAHCVDPARDRTATALLDAIIRDLQGQVDDALDELDGGTAPGPRGESRELRALRLRQVLRSRSRLLSIAREIMDDHRGAPRPAHA